MKILAIESSCDETAVAIIDGSSQPPLILSSEISSQIDLHRAYGGVVPELASRNHTLNIRPLINQALKSANLTINEIEAYAATGGPGLASSLLVGNTAAKALALASNKPFLSINHIEGHLLSPFIDSAEAIPAHISLIVSGGHTMLVAVNNVNDYNILGKTRDDAAGEAFDKVGKMLGLPYPGGPEIEKAAITGDPNSFRFPRAHLKDSPLDFSFSGLKTAVLYTLEKLENPASHVPDIAASFQTAVVDALIKKTIKAAKTSELFTIAVSGGVSCNNFLRDALTHAAKQNDFELYLCPKQHSTDNAVMIAFAALQRFRLGVTSPLDEPINPNLSLATTSPS